VRGRGRGQLLLVPGKKKRRNSRPKENGALSSEPCREWKGEKPLLDVDVGSSFASAEEHCGNRMRKAFIRKTRQFSMKQETKTTNKKHRMQKMVHRQKKGEKG